MANLVDHFLKTRVSLSLSHILHGRLLCNGNRASIALWVLTARDDNPCRHRRLEKLYFLTASRVLFSNPPHISKFWTFPVVQLFLTCIPSLAIYVMGKYASYEFKRMKAVAELKKKEERKHHVIEFRVIEKREVMGSDSEFSNLKSRVDALEAAMQEIESELRKMPSVTKTKDEEEHKKRLQLSDVGSNTKNATGNNPTRLKLEEPALNSVIEPAKQKPEVNASNGGIS
ncbi:hypothetical protein LOK49_LG11G01408 [Camellia lanceoleosa]|uniref:Uncharacterized protein n=1 Tax=Camellia lanceoleosa TaxID=1840588 RepID=A0ACC0FXV8_9ERIC|nr:hypothetical protein LOK49_LG11G01408 [Camellia lanceoleosa]